MEEDVEVLQSAEAIDKAPIFNIFEMLSQTTFVEKIKMMMTTTKLSFICWRIVLQVYNTTKLLYDKESAICCRICLILR